MNIKFVIVKLMALACMLLSATTHSALFPRDLDGDPSNGHEGVYDDVLDITWLANANLPRTQVMGLLDFTSIGGAMSQLNALSYAEAMNTANYLGYSGWRLPNITPINGIILSNFPIRCDGGSDSGWQTSAPIGPYNPNGVSSGTTRSEIAFHYYNNFQAVGSSFGTLTSCNSVNISVYGITNAPDLSQYKSLFTNIENDSYWLDSDVNPSGWMFFFDEGFQHQFSPTLGKYTWPVHDGDIGNAIVETNEVNMPFLPMWAIIGLGLAIVGVRVRLQSYFH